MTIELQAAAGLLTGLLAGLAFGLLRPLLVFAVAVLAIYVAAALALGGPPAIGALIGRIGTTLGAYPVYFAALAVAKAFGWVLVSHR